jgi:hypothetical protein
MRFQDFCEIANEKEKQSNRQIVTATNTFVISYTNKTGKQFTVDPKDIVSFLEVLKKNYKYFYEKCTNPEGEDNFANYNEDRYRAIYKLAGEFDGLAAISSAGGSQTRPITMVIAKLICYVANFEYVPIEENTFFDEKSIENFLVRLPESIGDFDSNRISIDNSHKEIFKRWMRKNGLSERSIYSYSETSMNYAKSLLHKIGEEYKDIYDVKSSVDVLSLLERLQQQQEWKDKDYTGKNMYSGALKQYAQFLVRKEKTITLSKPFILLAGVSGTGKSRFIKMQALDDDSFCSVAVRPDWHEPSDLLGYVSRLSGTPEYHVTDVLSFFVKAWTSACNLSETTATNIVNKNPVIMETYWLCLDEMNLAPVEQYFADYLSVIETRQWIGDNYTCSPLLKAETFSCLEPAELGKLRTQLEINDAQYDSMWSYFTNVGIPVPPNLIVAGTVNMDETTHGFSRKVIDRALTFDFGKFFPNDFDQYLEPTVRAKSFSFPTLSKVTKEDLSGLAFDADGVKTIQFCKDLNNILKDSAFELAFRALNELLISLVCINPKDESELQAVWDDFLMTKVLPRIEGDADKLSVIGKDEAILEALTSFLDNTFSEIKTERIDFFREEDGKPVKIPCRSIAKIKWMQDRLNKATFTSFWP